MLYLVPSLLAFFSLAVALLQFLTIFASRRCASYYFIVIYRSHSKHWTKHFLVIKLKLKKAICPSFINHMLTPEMESYTNALISYDPATFKRGILKTTMDARGYMLPIPDHKA